VTLKVMIDNQKALLLSELAAVYSVATTGCSTDVSPQSQKLTFLFTPAWRARCKLRGCHLITLGTPLR